MNIGVQFHTKTGEVIIADVINRKVMSVTAQGDKSPWQSYEVLKGGYVGEKLTVVLPPTKDGWATRPIMTEEIIKLNFPKLGD